MPPSIPPPSRNEAQLKLNSGLSGLCFGMGFGVELRTEEFHESLQACLHPDPKRIQHSLHQPQNFKFCWLIVLIFIPW